MRMPPPLPPPRNPVGTDGWDDKPAHVQAAHIRIYYAMMANWRRREARRAAAMRERYSKSPTKKDKS